MNVSFSGNRAGPCIRCGGTGHVPDGVFNFIGNTIDILSAPERTVSELLGLARLLREAQAKGENREQVAARIETELPSLLVLTKLLPTNKNELYGFLGVVIAAVTLYLKLSLRSRRLFNKLRMSSLRLRVGLNYLRRHKNKDGMSLVSAAAGRSSRSAVARCSDAQLER
jgi:hypothetical protein